MAFSEDLTEFFDTTHGFAEQVVVAVGAVNTTLTGIFIAPHVGDALGGAPVNLPSPQILFQTSAWVATTAKNGDTVTRAGTVYTVVDVQAHDDGLTTVTLRKYA